MRPEMGSVVIGGSSKSPASNDLWVAEVSSSDGKGPFWITRFGDKGGSLHSMALHDRVLATGGAIKGALPPPEQAGCDNGSDVWVAQFLFPDVPTALPSQAPNPRPSSHPAAHKPSPVGRPTTVPTPEQFEFFHLRFGWVAFTAPLVSVCMALLLLVVWKLRRAGWLRRAKLLPPSSSDL